MGGYVVGIECLERYMRRSSDFEIRGDGLERVGALADQVQGITACGQNASGGLGNRRSRAHDQDSSHLSSITRRQKVEEQRGSMYCENSCQRGKPLRNRL